MQAVFTSSFISFYPIWSLVCLLCLRSTLLYPSDHPRFLPRNMVRSISRFRNDCLTVRLTISSVPRLAGVGAFIVSPCPWPSRRCVFRCSHV
ncbi:hypothetical protein BDR03DRAFT_968791 [Suillus americanus]|nr:hypothetical protein BDR03DRAFT_968791 [Suillus americanus]